METTPQFQIGPYRVGSRIGRGGMGEVFRAWDSRLERWVAIKRFLPGYSQSSHSSGFLREARAAAGLGHPGIVQVFDLLSGDRGDWIVMELIHGPTLAELLRDGPLDALLTLNYGSQVASALDAAHSHGIIHRDIKSENAMVMPSGHIKILDFGLAQKLDLDPVPRDGWPSGRGAGRTKRIKIAGTPRAMSPEQAMGLTLDPRSDLFALGVLLYEMCTARSPFQGRTPEETLRRVVTHQQPPAHHLAPRLPRRLSSLIDRLLEKQPTLRPADAAGVHRDLAAMAAGDGIRGSVAPPDGSGVDKKLEHTTVHSSESPGPVRVCAILLIELCDGSLEPLEMNRFGGSFEHRLKAMTHRLAEVNGGKRGAGFGGRSLLFGRPTAAVCFAIAYHRNLRELAESQRIELVARIAIHLGEVIRFPSASVPVTDSETLHGAAFATCQRLLGLVPAGQIFLTRAAFDVVQRNDTSDLPEDLKWASHGAFHLRGLRDAIHVFGVGTAEASLEQPRPRSDALRLPTRSESPPEATMDGKPLALRSWPSPPLPPHPFPLLLPYAHPLLLAGRDREIAEIRRCLRLSISILGLIGASGSGKSSVLLAGLVPALRRHGEPVAVSRHPHEQHLAETLLNDLLAPLGSPGRTESPRQPRCSDEDPRRFVEYLLDVERLAGEPATLILDQFESVLLPNARSTRMKLARLIASSVVRRPGITTPICRWILAYRSEYHGAVTTWLADILGEALAEPESDPTLAVLPRDLSGPERFHVIRLLPLASPWPGASPEEQVADAARIFRDVIEKPLALQAPTSVAATSDAVPEMQRQYRWRFADGHSERLAEVLAESRQRDPDAPLTPELQVTLAHLIDRASANGVVVVGEDIGESIHEALSAHLQRVLERVFPTLPEARAPGSAQVDRARALLTLRELATRKDPQRGMLLSDLARVLGPEGRVVIEKLSTPSARLLVVHRASDGLRCSLSHDRMAEVLVDLVDEEGRRGALIVDAELLALRRFVALQTALYGSQTDQATRLSRRHYRLIQRHHQVLLWQESQRRWWAACVLRRRLRNRRRVAFALVALIALSTIAAGAWSWAQQMRRDRALLERIAGAEPGVAIRALDRLIEEQEISREQILLRLRQRPVPMDVLSQGLESIERSRQPELVLILAEVVLPWVAESPEDMTLLANSVWALDAIASRDRRFVATAGQIRDRLLQPLRRLYPPPAEILEGDDWIRVPEAREGASLRIRSFLMLRHEVTNGEFRRLFPHHRGRAGSAASFVNWYKAYSYAAWLGGRLPTEAEWEHAAIASCEARLCDRRRAAAELDSVAWYLGNTTDPETGDVVPQAVMGREPNPWGLYDMVGNVAEWTSDWHHRRPPGDPRAEWGRLSPAAPNQARRVLRGGTFRDAKTGIDRIQWVSPGLAYATTGFRVVLDPTHYEPGASLPPPTSVPSPGNTTRKPVAKKLSSGNT